MIRTHVHDRPKINEFSNQVQRTLYHSYGDLRLVNEILYKVFEVTEGKQILKYVIPTIKL